MTYHNLGRLSLNLRDQREMIQELQDRYNRYLNEHMEDIIFALLQTTDINKLMRYLVVAKIKNFLDHWSLKEEPSYILNQLVERGYAVEEKREHAHGEKDYFIFLTPKGIRTSVEGK